MPGDGTQPSQPRGVVYYQSVSRGLNNPDGKHAIAYFGKVYRIPRCDHATVRQLEWEVPPDELCPPTPGGVIERFEVFDQDTGDVWVM